MFVLDTVQTFHSDYYPLRLIIKCAIKSANKTGGNSRTLFTSKTATKILYLRRPRQVDISKSNDVITRGISAKACQLTFLWIKSDIPLHSIFITDVDQVLKAIAATGQQCNVISV